MKTLVKIFFVFLLVAFFADAAAGQSTNKEKKAAKIALIKKLVDEDNYVFTANFAIPLRGGQKNLTSDYDLRVNKDTVAAYLPYYGRAYTSPRDLYPTDGGIKFKITRFSYVKNEKKNGTWEITIKPKDKDIADWRDVQQLVLDISPEGYASLNVTSTNRDPISFQGYIEENGKR